MPGGAFAFGPFRLDVHSRRLTRGDDLIRLTPRQLDLLHILIGRPGEVIAKNVLVRDAWQDIAVTDNNWKCGRRCWGR